MKNDEHQVTAAVKEKMDIIPYTKADRVIAIVILVASLCTLFLLASQIWG